MRTSRGSAEVLLLDGPKPAQTPKSGSYGRDETTVAGISAGVGFSRGNCDTDIPRFQNYSDLEP